MVAFNATELGALARGDLNCYFDFLASHPIFFDDLAAFYSLLHKGIHYVSVAAGPSVELLHCIESMYAWCMW